MKGSTIKTAIIILATIIVIISVVVVCGIFYLNQKEGNKYNDLYAFLACPGFALIALFAILVQFQKTEERAKKLQTFAGQHSFNYQKTVDLTFLAELDEMLNEGTFREYAVPLYGKSSNVISGKIAELDFVVFDQYYSDSRTYRTTNSRVFHNNTVIAIKLPGYGLPFFFMYPQGAYDSILNSFSEFDINFPMHPAFSQKFVLRGNNDGLIAELFHERILSFYERPLPFTTTIGGGNYLLIYRSGLLSTGEIMPQVQLIEQLARLFLNK